MKPLSREQLQSLSGEEFFARYNKKLCYMCHKAKSYICFPLNSWSKDGRASYCRDCEGDYKNKQQMEYEKK